MGDEQMDDEQMDEQKENFYDDDAEELMSETNSGPLLYSLLGNVGKSYSKYICF
jgi:hypothetical protein